MRQLFSYLVFAAALTASAAQLSSPSGRVTLTVETGGGGVPIYSLSYDRRPVIEPSALGICGQQAELTRGFTITAIDTCTVDESWTPVWGQYASIRCNYREMCVTLTRTEPKEQVMKVRFRLFDDGLGFRYELPAQPGLNYLKVTREMTEFNLPGDPTFYCSPGDYDTDEYLYTTSPASGLAEAFRSGRYKHSESSMIKGLVVQTPLIVKTADSKPLYINIHEANLRNYGGMSLNVTTGASTSLTTHITPDRNGICAYVKCPFQTPWRTVVVSDDARDILASSLILNLNEPCALASTDWIKPTKFMGVWWEMFQGDGGSWAYSDDWNAQPGVTDYSKLQPSGRHRANNDNVRRYIDFASEHHIPALLVEGWNEGWEDWSAYNKNRQFDFTRAYPDFDVDGLQQYALSKGVRLIMHHETAGNAADYERQLTDAFQFMKDHGYNSVKTGYVGFIIPRSEHHSSQWMVDHYIHVADLASKYGIMVDSHEAVRPTGLCRTYPNWVAQESARGGEFESMGGNPPEHTILLAFTRLMGGPMDYTPGLFEPHPLHVSKGGTFEGGSTIAKQLALYLTLPSPLQMACDMPWNYEKYLDAFKFIEDVPVDWADSRYLEAEPGDYITVARLDKNSSDWYVGGITDENARSANIDFSFLPKGVKYTATIYADAPDADYRTNPTGYVITTKQVTSKTRLRQPLAPGGGFAIRLTPAN